MIADDPLLRAYDDDNVAIEELGSVELSKEEQEEQARVLAKYEELSKQFTAQGVDLDSLRK